MNIDTKKYWDIETKHVCIVKNANPLATSKGFIINNEYFLKESHKDTNSELLLKLKQAGVPVETPLGRVVEGEDAYYSLFRFIRNEPMDFTDLKQAEEIGKALALVNLAKPGLKIANESINDSLCKIEKRLREFYFEDKRLEIIPKVYLHLGKELLPFTPYMNISFSHGDMHPGNVLIQSRGVGAIVDWELAGVREELYDLAFFLGCIGISNPLELASPWVKKLISTYVNKAKPTKLAFSLLPELVLATRLKWLYKWSLIKTDNDMISMERLLLMMVYEKRDAIRREWMAYAGTDFKPARSKWVMQDAFETEEIEKAKARIGDVFSAKLQNNDQTATDLRLLAIDYGMKDDIISVVKILGLLFGLENDSSHLKVEQMLAMGNASLDFSKFGMIDGLRHIVRQGQEIIKEGKSDDLLIGFAFMLRNSSIAFAEAGEMDRSFEMIALISKIAEKTGHVEIKGEYARALSNGITSILSHKNGHSYTDFFSSLEDLHKEHPESKKIHGAYMIAKTNIEKSRAE
jgi:Ser/Thr protein kinase RdoA (MazF antagonist)